MFFCEFKCPGAYKKFTLIALWKKNLDAERLFLDLAEKNYKFILYISINKLSLFFQNN